MGIKALGEAKIKKRSDSRPGSGKRPLRRVGAKIRVEPPPAGPIRRTIDMTPLSELLGYQIRRAELATFQNFAAVMARHRLSPGQVGALILIERNPGLKQSELAMALGIDRSSAVPLLDRLERRGVVARGRRDHDRRSHALSLTPRGRALLKRARRRLEFHEAAIASQLSPAEIKTLRSLLSRVGRQ